MAKATKKSTKKTAVKRTVKRAATQLDVLEQKGRAIGRKANTVAKKNPWALAGIAAGVGLIVGMVARGGSTEKKRK
jgi:ElaB/YqjD/DUF883 family membrane-anchored ribosome-binding protein